MYAFDAISFAPRGMICQKIVAGEEVTSALDDMIWANKLAKANTSAMEMLRLARRTALNPGDDFFNGLNLGDPDPSSHRSGLMILLMK